jgi:hypothetical protein
LRTEKFRRAGFFSSRDYEIRLEKCRAVAFDIAVDFEVGVGVGVGVEVAFDVAVAFEFRIGTLPNETAVSRELWEDMFERSEFVFPPG